MAYTTLVLEQATKAQKRRAKVDTSIGIGEQETVITFGRGHQTLTVWTNDITEIRFIETHWIETGKAISHKYAKSDGALTAELPIAYLTRNKPRKEKKIKRTQEQIEAMQRGRKKAKLQIA